MTVVHSILCVVFAIFMCISYRISSNSNHKEAMSLIFLEFEVFGKVQGVFFRKFTNEKALRKGQYIFVQCYKITANYD